MTILVIISLRCYQVTKKALLGEASKLRTPVKVNEATSNVSNEQPGTKKRQRQIDFVNANSSNHNNSISVHVNTNDVSGKAETVSNAKKSRSEKQCNNEFSWPRDKDYVW